MLTLYGIPNCDTVKRARQALQAAGIDHRFHDFRKDGLSQALAQGFIDALGLDRVLNRRGTTWRQLDEATRAALDQDNAAELLVAHPALIKRPVWVRGAEHRVGFARAEQADHLRWAAS